jgi:hypothetical protein
MILLPLVSLIILPFLARAQVGPVPTGIPVNILDFQRNVFDLVNGQPNGPVQGLDHRVNDTAQRVRMSQLIVLKLLTKIIMQWVIQLVQVLPSGNQVFTIMNPTAKTFLTYSTAGIIGNPLCSQLFGESNQPTGWIISPGNFGYGSVPVQTFLQLDADYSPLIQDNRAFLFSHCDQLASYIDQSKQSRLLYASASFFRDPLS